MSAPETIRELVRAFKKDEQAYYATDYSEAQARITFIDPFLEALGWHPRPDPNYIAEWRDCVVENPVNVKDAEHKKRADYTCRIGKTPVLIVEAKTPRDDIFTVSQHALQIRRYAYSQKLPIGILTNFAKLSIYDGRVLPKKDDKYQVARIETIRYTEYEEKWDLIESLLGKEGVQRGAQREYMQRRIAKGLIPVDQAILAEIDRWREELAHVIARLNPDLNAEALGFCVGRIIDRMLFLRVSESRGMEPEGQLGALLKTKDKETYPRLLELFMHADARYNSGLFYFKRQDERAEKPDLLAQKLDVEGRAVKQIIKGLYYPENLYRWNLIPVEILGQVYEQFLGKVIVVPKRGSAKVEDKPEVKKAGGVYYTPTYIVDYIVEHTVGKLFEGKTPKDTKTLRVLDPACGSGSFLLGAYQFLLDWHLKFYMEDGPAKHQKEIVPDADEGYRLTLRERKRILTDHIFGVDIDAQAVEVTKLSLLLKVLEGETHDTVESELKLRVRALPDLGKNIKCGNSLIGTDIEKVLQQSHNKARGFNPLSGGEKEMKARDFNPLSDRKDVSKARGFNPLPDTLKLSKEDWARINPFDWECEFPQVFMASARQLWLVTFVTHNARVSDRMVEFGIRKGEPLVFGAEEREQMADILTGIWRRHGIPVVAANVLSDHVHLIVAAEDEKQLEDHVHDLKGASAHAFQQGISRDDKSHIWQQKFNRKPLNTESALHDALEYVWNNHLKHDNSDKGLKPLALQRKDKSGKGLQPLDSPNESGTDKGLKPLALTQRKSLALQKESNPPYIERLRAACVTVEEAVRAGGFDAVIGNPPYVRQETLGLQFKTYAQARYDVYTGIADLYTYFIEQSHRLLRTAGGLA